MHTAECTWGARGGMYVGRSRRGLVASAPTPTGYFFSAPLSGLWHEGVGLRLARRPSGPKRRRARAVADTTRSPARPHPQETRQIKPRQGRIRLSRWALARMRQAPGARTPRTSRSRRASHVPRLPGVRRANGRSGVALKMRSTLSHIVGQGSESHHSIRKCAGKPSIHHGFRRITLPYSPAPRCLRLDLILAVPLDRCVARCAGGKGCTWGAGAGSRMYVGCTRAGGGMYVGHARRELAASAAAPTG